MHYFYHFFPIFRGPEKNVTAKNKLHWLPVKERIQYKTLLFTYQALQGTAPTYLQDMISLHQNEHSMSLRCTSSMRLTVPRTKMITYGDRTFAYAAPKLWNCLPDSVKNSKSLEQFKSVLKTHLFKQAYF